MTPSDTIALLYPLITLALVAAAFAGREWIAARVAKTVQHNLDIKLEGLRSEQRESEERVKSQLRDREAEVSAMRTNLLTGSAGRQALLEKRRVEALEKIWIASHDFGQLKGLAAAMSTLKFDAVAKRSTEPKMQQFIGAIGATAPSNISDVKNVAKHERPFVPEEVWAYFSAYTSILLSNLLRFHILKTGLDHPRDFMTFDNVKKLLKAVLPHHAAFLDKHDDVGTYVYLLEEIEEKLLHSIRRALDGKDVDQAAKERATAIIEAVKKFDHEQPATGQSSTIAAGRKA